MRQEAIGQCGPPRGRFRTEFVQEDSCFGWQAKHEANCPIPAGGDDLSSRPFSGHRQQRE
jgi:hypothetical protein